MKSFRMYSLLFTLIPALWVSGCRMPVKDVLVDRRAVVDRHKVISTATDPESPAQVGNGGFAIGVDVTGLQTFVPFNTLSDWSWHSFPLSDSVKLDDYRGVMVETRGKPLRYELDDGSAAARYMQGNPHRFTLGRLGFDIRKADGTPAQESDLQQTRQEVDLWTGIITSTFSLEGKPVKVRTACHPELDAVAVSVTSPLVAEGRLSVLLDFPYPIGTYFEEFMGDYDRPEAHVSTPVSQTSRSAVIERQLDDTHYYTALRWTSPGSMQPASAAEPHRVRFLPGKTDKIGLTCTFSEQREENNPPAAGEVFAKSVDAWREFWNSGAAIDLSGSEDARWQELERRIVLSQYVMRVNEAGVWPPQESGLVNNGWYGRFHFEMIWWHGVHYGLWGRWPLFDRCLHVYKDFLPGAVERAGWQGMEGAKWPKCTADLNREWPCDAHGYLAWQQPHPIYFAEQEYRLSPTRETLDKWAEVVFRTADYMADFVHFDEARGTYVMGPPVYVMSENVPAEITLNPVFELGYWRYGLRVAQEWRERLGLPAVEKWADVEARLAPLPVQEGVYVTFEGIRDMWSKYNYEHPGLTGTLGMLPGDGVDEATFKRTFARVVAEWDFDRTWGWDFPMMAMAAARTGQPELAVDMLLHTSENFRFDRHGLASGGPYPYFPSNGALLAAVAMMAGGWDGSEGDAPGFPKNGRWKIRCEGFVPMQ